MKALLLLLLALLPLASSAFPYPKGGRYYGTLVYRTYQPDNRSTATSQRVTGVFHESPILEVYCPPLVGASGQPQRVTYYLELPQPDAVDGTDVVLLHTKDDMGNWATTETGTFKIRGRVLTLTFSFPQLQFSGSTVFTLTYRDSL